MRFFSKLPLQSFFLLRLDFAVGERDSQLFGFLPRLRDGVRRGMLRQSRASEAVLAALRLVKLVYYHKFA